MNLKYASTNQEPKEQDFESEEYSRTDKEWDITDELNLIVTHDFDVNDIHYSLPRFIQLTDLKPGEPRFLKRRSRRVARFHKFNKLKNPHEYYYSELQLYSEYKDENDLEPENFDKCKALYDRKSSHNNISRINNVKSVLMEYLQSVEEGTERAEEMHDTNVGNILDSAFEQDNEDCEEIGTTTHADFVHKDPSNFYDQTVEERRYKGINLCDDQTLDTISSNLDEDQRLVLEIGVDFAKSIKKTRKNKDSPIEPPLLIVQGGAGSGKSTVIEALSQQMEKVLRTSGDNPDHPYIIKAAFTGTAAANIKGQTLHNAFSFGFGNEFFSLGDKVRDERRCELENLKIVIVDEFSMMKADMLYQLDLRLREVKSKPKVIFGGVSIFLFGDILQLRPVKGRYIMDEPRHEMFLLSFLTSSLWHKFDVIMLRQNHRQGEDRQYAELLNRARVGELTEEDECILKSRVKHLNDPIIPKHALVVTSTNAEVNKINEERLSIIEQHEYIIKAKTYTQTQSNLKPRTDPSGAIIGTTLQKELKLKIGARVMMTFNIDTCDCLTNGAFGEVLGFKFDTNGDVAQVYVQFYDEECGKARRRHYASLQLKYPGKNVTPVDLMEYQYSLSKKATTTASKNATAVQFPLRLAFAATGHKVQGQTIKKPNYLIVDLRRVREAAQAYVILSRVQSLTQLFIIEDVCIDKVYASSVALEELARMNNVALNLRQREKDIIISGNIRSLKKNFVNLSKSSIVKDASVICLQETWLDHSEKEYKVSDSGGLLQHNNVVGRGKGISTLYQSNFEVEKIIRTPSYQITKLTSDSRDIINLYRSSGANTASFLSHLNQLINLNKHTLVLGDFNICYNEERINPVFQKLRSLGFKQLVQHATHIDGRLIDLVFSLCPGKEISYLVEQQAQYYLDHDLISIVGK